MPGNRLRFEEAIQKANDFVWAEQWNDAIQAYRRALKEAPENVSALMGYAWALLNNEDLDEAVEVYEKLTKLSPEDPGPFERIAEIAREREESDRARTMYLAAAERYGSQDLRAKQTAALESALTLDPHNADAWDQLLELYRTQRNINRAILAALWLCYLIQDSDRDRAIEVCRQMQAFVPHEPRIGRTLMMLQSSRALPEPPPLGAEDFTQEEELTVNPEEESGTPVEIARQRALSKLAETIFAETKPEVPGLSQTEVDLLISKAVDAQTRGDLEQAVQAYERLVDAEVSMSSIHFNLGLLYKEQMHFDNAIEQLEASRSDPEYVLGSHFALGQCYQAKGDFKEALTHFFEAVKIVDIATIEREHVDDLIRVYEGLAQTLVNAGVPEQAKKVSEMLVDFMGQRGWEDGAVKARERLDQLARTGTVLSLAELVSLPDSDVVMRSIALAQEYQRRKRLHQAQEELYHAMSYAPDYLPLHHLLGQILKENGHIDEAVRKFGVIAKTYEIRGQTPQALATYEQVLDLSPLNIPVHQRVVELQIQHGRIDDALMQYLQISDAYYQLAQPARAREAYEEALRLAPRGSSEKQWKLRILHRIADLDIQSLDWIQATKDNEEILNIAPNDERAHLALYRLYPRTGRPHLGINALDRLIRQYLKTRKVDKALAVLEDLLDGDPDSIPLQARAAQLYLNIGERDKALAHLDVLGDLQLEAGQKDAAVKTIEAILALDPTNREAYEDLYREITHREPPGSN